MTIIRTISKCLLSHLMVFADVMHFVRSDFFQNQKTHLEKFGRPIRIDTEDSFANEWRL